MPILDQSGGTDATKDLSDTGEEIHEARNTLRIASEPTLAG